MKRRSFLKVVSSATTGMAVGVNLAFGKDTLPVVGDNKGMPLRVLGRTGFKVSVTGFAGLALSNGTQEEGTKALHQAFDRGLNYYDVAPAYGRDGDCEIKMGVGLQGLDRSRYILGCKTKKRDKDGAREELERSLKRLKTDYFDLYQMHHLVKPEEVKTALGPGGAIETFLKAKEEGKIRAIGFSAHTTKAALEALRSYAFDTVMFPISFSEYYTRGFGKEVLSLAKEKGTAVISIKTIHAGAWPQGGQRKRQWWYRPLEEQDDINLAYRWTLSLPGVVIGIPIAFLDLQDKSTSAGIAYKPATEDDAKKLEEMAKGQGSIFKREEDMVAMGGMHDIDSPYPHHPHDSCPCEGVYGLGVERQPPKRTCVVAFEKS